MSNNQGFPHIAQLGRKLAIVSDLHMGDTRDKGTEASLLDTYKHDPRESPNWLPNPQCRLADFVYLLGQACAKVEPVNEPFDVLILLGDIFDTSLATFQETVANVREFLVRVGNTQCVRSYLYIPGNHDHHLWTMINEEHEIATAIHNYQGAGNSTGILPRPFYRQTDSLYTSTFLDSLLAGLPSVPSNDGSQEPPKLYVASPNAVCQYDNNVLYIFHHGHLLSDSFTLISDLLDNIKKTPDLEVLEEANSGWTEFGWYYMGQTRQFGQVIEDVYNGLRKRPEPDKAAVDAITKVFDYLWDQNIQKNIPGFIKLIDLVPGIDVKKMARNFIIEAIKGRKKSFGASDARNTPLAGQLQQIRVYLEYLKKEPQYGISDGTQVQFVYGHTHRYGEFSGPIRNSYNVSKPSQEKCEFDAFNCGTWKDAGIMNNRILTINNVGELIVYPQYYEADARIELFEDENFRKPGPVLYVREGAQVDLEGVFNDKLSSFRLIAPTNVALYLYEHHELGGRVGVWKGVGMSQPNEVNKSDLKVQGLHDNVSSLRWDIQIQ